MDTTQKEGGHGPPSQQQQPLLPFTPPLQRRVPPKERERLQRAIAAWCRGHLRVLEQHLLSQAPDAEVQQILTGATNWTQWQPQGKWRSRKQQIPLQEALFRLKHHPLQARTATRHLARTDAPVITVSYLLEL
jgi:hypothetical protein